MSLFIIFDHPYDTSVFGKMSELVVSLIVNPFYQVLSVF